MADDDYNKPAPESEMKSAYRSRRAEKARQIREKLEQRRRAEAENKEINP